jgi:tetratricopeptide (TPR) repeat protein
MRGEASDPLFGPALPTYSMTIVSALDEIPDSVGGLTALTPQLKLLASFAAFIQQLLPFTRLTLGGSLVGEGRRGVGVVLTLRNGKVIERTATLWEKPIISQSGVAVEDRSAADDFSSLVPLASGWLHFELARTLQTEPIPVSVNAESYAYLKRGLEMQVTNRTDDAISMYAVALTYDPYNYAALANLGRLNALRGNVNEALRLFDEALRAREATNA